MLRKSFHRAYFSTAESTRRVYRIPGKNINVASHNEERRQEFKDDFGFIQTWNMGVEGFSKPHDLPEMNPILGNKREFIWLFAFLGLVPLLASGRKSNEDGLRSEVQTTNRFARLPLDSQSKQLSKL